MESYWMSAIKVTIGMAAATSCYLAYKGWLGQAYKYSKYQTTLNYILGRHLYDPISYPWWNQIEQGLYLGGLPLKHMPHMEDLQRLGITDVITINEDFEISISAKEWQDRGITNHRFVAEDFLPVSQDQLKTGADLIHQLLMKGRVIYVHCKAGVGRSASLVVAYLIKYGSSSQLKFETINDAIDYASQKRQLINLNHKQRLALHEYKESLGQSQ